mgnify:CR=1 FL=1
MRLLYITNGIKGSGGLERVLSIKTNYLIEVFDYDVHIVVLNNDESSSFYDFNEKIKIHNLDLKDGIVSLYYNYFKGLRNSIKEINPDIVTICDDGFKGFLLPFVLKFKPIVYERHASIELNTIGFNKLNRILIHKTLRFLANFFDSFIVLTEANKLEWNTKNAIVIPNFYSFYPKESSLLQNKTVIAVGSHSYNKGYDLLLYSWKEITKEFPDWVLEVYGKVDTNETYLKLAKALQIDAKVAFFQPNKEIEQKYIGASVFVLSSRSEGFGMVLLEAMACGVPCVSFNCPSGPGDIIKHGKDGFLVPMLDQDVFQNKVKLLMRHYELRKEMGTQAKENVKRFSVENIMEKWNDLYKSLVNENCI